MPRCRTIRSPARAARLHRVEHGDYPRMPSGRFLHPQHPFAQVSKFLDCNSAMSRSRQSLAGSRIAEFTVVGYFI